MAAPTPGPGWLPEEEQAYVDSVREWVEARVRPVARGLDHRDEYPESLVESMKAMGVYGLVVPPPYGEGQVSTGCFVGVTEELARGWMSLAGAMGGHSVVALLLARFGTEDQKAAWLPRLATGEVRATMALTEPSGGSDLAALQTVARRGADGGYVVDGSKTWITNAARAGVVALLCKTDTAATPAHNGMSILLVTPADGYVVSPPLPKLGYHGVESCEVSFASVPVGPDALLGGVEGRGFAQMMTGLELGRIQVAARAVGVAQAALDDALAYAQQRESFGVPIWRHQSVGDLLAEMATRVHAARLVTRHAAQRFDSGERSDLEAGMAKLFASEVCLRVTADALRVHGGHGYSTELDVERYYRDAPLMVLGEGTNEIQRGVIVRQLVARGGLDRRH